MVVITQEGNLSAPLTTGLFHDLSFWVSLTVPGRGKLIEDIKKNGGTVSQAERHATYLLVDDRKPPLPDQLHDPKRFGLLRYGN
ncbi:Similar to transcription factor Rap1 [Ajellomyces dermatitidis ATCC 18188]; acc. no. EGE82813 [Pyronema omphalodes CBS 100304]|uniref:Similar to transcription factor Rap1 [Ajellomyces dermatitidis ATCC 18188] acc. no. EGE82813 n=1 Tax=Pyronema omphalodes (strain CBS 100304) TaxID=1076935 RepID=U4LJP5_PYROM|nr:Similar to transcription factor Rap1 [Ajellomyces dermatitidis ATCC 18188]; acc. no. EGE82813 [Pyronema omphalodes CBS 100304]